MIEASGPPKKRDKKAAAKKAAKIDKPKAVPLMPREDVEIPDIDNEKESDSVELFTNCC